MKEFKRKLERGPVDHELDVRCKVDPETLRLLTQFSEREIPSSTELRRKPVRLSTAGGTVTRKAFERIRRLAGDCLDFRIADNSDPVRICLSRELGKTYQQCGITVKLSALDRAKRASATFIRAMNRLSRIAWALQNQKWPADFSPTAQFRICYRLSDR